MERGKLQNALLNAVKDAPCRLGVWVTALDQRNGRVWVSSSDGASGEYDLVIGADGIGSTVRALALNEIAPSYCGQMTWRSLAPKRPDYPAEVQFWLGDGCFFGFFPISSEHEYGFGYVAEPNRRRDPTEGRLARLRERFSGFGGAVRDYLDRLERDDEIHCAPIESLELDRWLSGRVMLIGDAAHASSPMMGQGGCMAIEDAFVLAELMDASENVEIALDAFVARRRPRVDWVQSQSGALGQNVFLPPGIRDAVLRERGAQAFRARYAPLLTAP